MSRKICVITGTRADYGLLTSLMGEIRASSALQLQIIATGMHLSPEFGLTYKEIERDGFTIDQKIEILLSSDTPVGIAKAMGLAMIGFADAFQRLQPHIVVGLGDRFELFAAVSAASVARIPVAHISGGEVTEGAIDEAIRHSVTKMSQLHFTSTEEYRRRVIQLGEDPSRVYNVGEIGYDNLQRLTLRSRQELEEMLGFRFAQRNLLVTFHPVTLENGTAETQFANLLLALDELPETFIIFTKPNADTDGRILITMIDDYVAAHREKSIAFTSMGQLNYLSALQYVDAVVGNSSSGIVEAPMFRRGTINIGDRQKGRLRTPSIVDVEPDYPSIRAAFERLYSKEFHKTLQEFINPYAGGGTSAKIRQVLETVELEHLVKKKFYDVDMML